MTKRTFLLILFAFFSFQLFSQETKIYFGIGGIYHSFQDVRFSETQINSISFKPEVGYNRITDKDYWLTNASAFYFEDNYPGFDTVQISSIGFNINVGYLTAIKPSFYLGGTWDVIDYLNQDNSFLENSSNFYKTSSDLFISGKYIKQLSSQFRLQGGLDYGLLSFLNTAPSFTANFPQNVVDNGEVSFGDVSTRDPHNLRIMKAKPFWNHFLIRTQIQCDYKKRISLTYIWNMRSYADHKGYPITTSMHSLLIRYNFLSRLK